MYNFKKDNLLFEKRMLEADKKASKKLFSGYLLALVFMFAFTFLIVVSALASMKVPDDKLGIALDKEMTYRDDLTKAIVLDDVTIANKNDYTVVTLKSDECKLVSYFKNGTYLYTEVSNGYDATECFLKGLLYAILFAPIGAVCATVIPNLIFLICYSVKLKNVEKKIAKIESEEKEEDSTKC